MVILVEWLQQEGAISQHSVHRARRGTNLWWRTATSLNKPEIIRFVWAAPSTYQSGESLLPCSMLCSESGLHWLRRVWPTLCPPPGDTPAEEALEILEGPGGSRESFHLGPMYNCVYSQEMVFSVADVETWESRTPALPAKWPGWVQTVPLCHNCCRLYMCTCPQHCRWLLL